MVLLTLLLFTQAPAAESIAQMEKTLNENPALTPVREQLAVAYAKGGKQDKVIRILAPYTNEISDDSLVILSEAYSASKDYSGEIRALQIYAERNPDRFRPHHLLGLAYIKSKNTTEAATHLRTSIQLAPKHKPSYEALLNLFVEAKKNYECRLLLNDMIRIFGNKKEYLHLQCKLFNEDGYLEQAVESCKGAVANDPKFPDSHVYLANTYYNQGNITAAERIFRTASVQFKNSEFVQYATGEFYRNEKNYPTSVRYLENAVKINKTAMRSQLALAQALFEDKRYADALRHFENSCKLDKSSDTLTELKTAAARLLKIDQQKLHQQYKHSAALCQR